MAPDEVLMRSLLRESATAPTYTFSYEPICEAVYSQAGQVRRRLFGRRA